MNNNYKMVLLVLLGFNISFVFVSQTRNYTPTKTTPDQLDQNLDTFQAKFAAFAKLYHHHEKTATWQKDFYRAAGDTVKAALELNSYMKTHKGQDKFITKEKRDEVEKLLKSMPYPTKKQIVKGRKLQAMLKSLAQETIKYMSLVPHKPENSKSYLDKVSKAIASILILQKFLHKHPGLIMAETQRKALLDGFERMKKVPVDVIKKSEKKKDHRVQNLTTKTKKPVEQHLKQNKPENILPPTIKTTPDFKASTQKQAAAPVQSPVVKKIKNNAQVIKKEVKKKIVAQHPALAMPLKQVPVVGQAAVAQAKTKK